MPRPIAILGAPSAIGIRPYDDGSVRRLDLAPEALRAQGLVARLGASDSGDVLPPAYRDFVRPPGRPRNEDGVAAYSRTLGRRIAAAAEGGAFVVVLGGDCSIVLGGLLGARAATGGRVGLAYLDAHADFATPQESVTGSAASMCLALAVGRGDSPLARLDGDAPLARAEDVILLGRRDHAEPWYGHGALAVSGILDLPHEEVRGGGASAAVGAALARLGRPEIAGFWIHLDADLLDPTVVGAVDSPEPGGLELEEAASVVRALARHPGAIGLELTIYDPGLDPGGAGAARLVELLERALGRT
jgi:arginase